MPADFLHRLRLNRWTQVAGAGEVIEQPSTSGFGPKLTFARREGMSAFEGKADMTLPRRHFSS